MTTYRMIGMMSGTSVDGIDLCCADFKTVQSTDQWSFQIIAAHSYPYSTEWRDKLVQAPTLSGEQLIQLHVDYSHLLGKTIREFITTKKLDNLDGVAVHGHTIFHQPENKMTFQIGDGETISTYVRCPVISNFRSKDVALEGQGAPLVPVGEAYLFSQYQLCLNLGGIANLSLLSSVQSGKEHPLPSDAHGLGALLTAFDVCPCNMLLNFLAQRLETGARDFDENGQAAAEGQLVESIFERLESLEYYSRPLGPKSLGREWFEQNVQPIIENNNVPVRDVLRTAVEHIAHQIGRAIHTSTAEFHQKSKLTMLVTGGGQRNRFLVERIQNYLNSDQVEMDSPPDMVDFKESLIFAFLGVRRLIGITNVDRRATKAASNSVSGAVHFGSL